MIRNNILRNKTLFCIISIVILLCFLLVYLYTRETFVINVKENEINDEIKNIYTAIIVEPRQHKALVFVLENFLENLSHEWNVIIFHGNKNETFLDNIIKNNLSSYKSRIKKINLKVDNLTITDYNNLLVSHEFYNYIPTEVFLVFQTDTVICEEYKGLINNFIQYDYVGAPWIDYNNNCIGNGGLSLRRKSKMLEIIDTCPYNGSNEDVYFVNCDKVKLNIPSIEKANTFSIETIFNDKSFGVHKTWNYLNQNEITAKISKCKALKKLIELNTY